MKTATVGVQAATTDYDTPIVVQRRGEIGKVFVYPFDRIADAMTDLETGRITAAMKVAPIAAILPGACRISESSPRCQTIRGRSASASPNTKSC
jgi:hypothetical protein